MAKETILTLSQAREDARNEKSDFAKGNRMVSGRMIPAGTYTFDADPDVRATTTKIGADEFAMIDVKSKQGMWISIGSLLKKTLNGDSLEFISEWVSGYSDHLGVAEALAGNKLEVERSTTDVYSYYVGNQRKDNPVKNGTARKTKLVMETQVPDSE